MVTRKAVSLLIGVLSGTALADIAYDAAGRTITVTGFDQRQPGTLVEVAKAAREAGWTVVTADDASQTVTVSASLVVGAGDGSSTWFRIGTPERPKETLIVNGDLIVHEPKAAGGYREFAGKNGLFIGDPSNPEIRPTVAFECSAPREHGLRVGDGTVLRVHRATVTAARQDAGHMAACEIRTGDVELVDSTLSWLGGDMTYGLHSVSGLVRGVTFEHGGIALGNGSHWVEGCTFRSLQTAAFDGGCLDATLVGCRFEANRRNFELAFTPHGIVAVDCFFGPESDPGPHVRRGRIGEGPWRYPSFVAKRHIVAEVTDAQGNAIEGAEVTVEELNGDVSGVDHGAAITGRDGRTPGPTERGAILLTDYGYRATEDPDNPRTYDFRYRVRVTAKGYQPVAIEDVDPDQSWVELPVVVQPD